MGHCICLHAQNIDQATAEYRQFVQLSNSGNQAQMYDALYKCYNSTLAVLENSANGSASYRGAYDNMKNIIPYLPNGAAYSSSKGMKSNAVLFAKAYVDVVTRPEFSNLGFMQSPSFAQMSYYAAAYMVNSKRYKEAIPYLRAYLKSGEEKYRKTVFTHLIKACANAGEYQTGVLVLDEALSSYPNDYGMLSTAVNFCIDSGDNTNLQRFVSKGLSTYPHDKTLLTLRQGLLSRRPCFIITARLSPVRKCALLPCITSGMPRKTVLTARSLSCGRMFTGHSRASGVRKNLKGE